jgi:hypothetical protein
MGMFKGLGAVKTKDVGQAYPKMLDINDLWDVNLETAPGVITCPALVWTKIFQYQVPAQTKVALGQGKLGSPAEEKGYAYGAFAACVGMCRVYAEDIHGNQEKLAEFRYEQLNAGGATFDRQLAMLLSESPMLIREDSFLTVWLRDDAGADMAAATDVIFLPCTFYKV